MRIGVVQEGLVLPISKIACNGNGGALMGGGPEGGPVRVRTWNVSWWVGERLGAFRPFGAQLWALQETKLAPVFLETARGALKREGYVLHHGQASTVHRAGGHGDRCGVGVLAASGVAVSPLMPQGAAWRRLHAMQRVHAVQVPPRPGLSLGLRLFTVYAPLQQDETRGVFNAAFLEMVATLDMQVPTLLLGDFNGTVHPEQDYNSGSGQVCPLLSRLLGPGGAFLDLQLVVSPQERAFTFHHERGGQMSLSRCDLALGNRAVLSLVLKVFVAPGIYEGGHNPVIVELRDQPSWALNWKHPRPKLPALLGLGSCDLRSSEAWEALLERWQASSVVNRLLTPIPRQSAHDISALLELALQELISLAGGWKVSSGPRRPAYESAEIRRCRSTLKLLGRCSSFLKREVGVGSFSYELQQLLFKLSQRGVAVPAFSRVALQDWVDSTVVTQRRALASAIHTMRAERVKRFVDRIPGLWETNPGVLFSWLRGDTPAWGSVPILSQTGTQCTTAEEVDRTVQDFWVCQVWRKHSSENAAEKWAAFQASPFFSHIPRCEWPQEE